MKNICLLVFIALASIACQPIGQTSANKSSINVSATGQVTVKPTHFTISASLITEKNSAKETRSISAKKAKKIALDLNVAGAPDRKILSDQLSLLPKYHEDSPKSFQIIKYRAHDVIQVENEPITRYAGILDALHKANVDNINAPKFMVENIKTQLNWARSDAITEARDKAKFMAETAGVELGPLLSLTEHQIGSTNQMEKDAKYTFPHSGEHTVKIQVDLKYEIKN